MTAAETTGLFTLGAVVLTGLVGYFATTAGAKQQHTTELTKMRREELKTAFARYLDTTQALMRWNLDAMARAVERKRGGTPEPTDWQTRRAIADEVTRGTIEIALLAPEELSTIATAYSENLSRVSARADRGVNQPPELESSALRDERRAVVKAMNDALAD